MVAVLSVSGNKVSSNCHEVVAAMRTLGLHGDVTCNLTLLDGTVEHGCRALIATKTPKDDLRRLWQALQATLELTCAHASITSDSHSGCVLDIVKPSSCCSCNGSAPCPS